MTEPNDSREILRRLDAVEVENKKLQENLSKVAAAVRVLLLQVERDRRTLEIDLARLSIKRIGLRT